MKLLQLKGFGFIPFFIIFYAIHGAELTAQSYLPTVMWHGMGDSCCNPFSMGRIKKLIEDRLPGIYVYSIRIGSNILADTEHGYIGNVNDHIKEVCDTISKDPQLQGGFNALGFSQGSQFLRALVQRCPSSKINNLISIGGQHQGIFGFPHCPSSPTDSRLCEYVRKLLNWGAYEDPIQNNLVQAQYWHDPLNEEEYKNHSIFLSDINNENKINESYKHNLLELSNFVLVKFLQDTMVVPKESEWFGFYAPGQDSEILPLQKTSVYTEDRLGLKVLDGSGKLQFLSVDADHLRFTEEWFLEQIVDPYLATDA